MHLLEKISITGNLSPMYGKLTLQYDFYNPDPTTYAPHFFFPLPAQAGIVALRLLTETKTLLTAELLPITETVPDRGFLLTQKSPEIYALSWESFTPETRISLLIDCILPLSPVNGRCRLSLPCGIRLPLAAAESGTAPALSVNLFLDDLLPASLSGADCYFADTKTFCSEAEGNQDFFRDFSVSAPAPKTLLQESFGQGIGICRLQTKHQALYQKPAFSRVQLLLDLSHAASSQVLHGLKELLYRTLLSLPPELPIRLFCAADGKPLPYSSFSLLTNEVRRSLFEPLQTLSVGGDITALLQNADLQKESGTLSILISDGIGVPDASLLCNLAQDSLFSLITLGCSQSTPLGSLCKAQNLFDHLHFFLSDPLEHILKESLSRLFYPEQEQILPEGGTVHDFFPIQRTSLAADGYQDIAFSYTGRPPQGFSVWKDGALQESITVSFPEVFPRFPDAEHLYALAKAKHLSRLLAKSSPSSARKIKAELTDLGIRFRLLTSETQYLLPLVGETAVSVPIQLFSAVGDTLPSPATRPTIFGEDSLTIPPSQKKILPPLCLEIIYHHIRSNGGIFSFATSTAEQRAEETALSALALALTTPDSLSVFQDAHSFLKENAHRSIWRSLLEYQQAATLSSSQLQEVLMSNLPPQPTLLEDLKNPRLQLRAAAMLLLHFYLM